MSPQDLARAVALYREHNPGSRARHVTTWSGSSGVVRRATCIFCRAVCATSAAKYPETKTSRASRDAHGAACARTYLDEHAGIAVLARAVQAAVAAQAIEEGV